MSYSLKNKLHLGEIVIGGFINFYAPDVVEIMGVNGCDYCVLDNEHGCFSPIELLHMVRAADSVGMSTIIRVDYDASSIQKALDMGAEGVQVPKVNTREDAALAVKRAKYPPEGDRGVGFSSRSARLARLKKTEYLQYANDNVLVVVQIETPEAIANIDEILSVPGVDVAFLGKMDLSSAIGRPGEVNSPVMNSLTDRFLDAVKRHGRIAGHIYDGSDLSVLLERNALYQSLPFMLQGNLRDLILEKNSHKKPE